MPDPMRWAVRVSAAGVSCTDFGDVVAGNGTGRQSRIRFRGSLRAGRRDERDPGGEAKREPSG